MQRYDAVILANVSRSSVDDVDNVASFSDEQIEMLVRNTRELGCGLVMIGGPDTFGAGGWANTKLEEAMPVDFQIKSAQVVPVGALCLMMHGGEMPQGELLAEADRRSSRSKRSAPATTAASSSGMAPTSGSGANRKAGMIRVGPGRQMMLARIDRTADRRHARLRRRHADGRRGLRQARRRRRQAHDHHQRRRPQRPPSNATMNALHQHKASRSAPSPSAPTARSAARRCATSPRKPAASITKSKTPTPCPRSTSAKPAASPGRWSTSRPIRCTPIVESAEHEILRGVEGGLPPIKGYVLTHGQGEPARRSDPPLAAAREARQLDAAGRLDLRRRQGGRPHHRRRRPLGHDWTDWDGYDKFFSQMIRWAMRPTGDTGNFTVATDVRDGKTEVVVTALDADDEFLNNQSMTAAAVAPDMKTVPIAIEQVAPGRYVGEFPSEMAGSYLIVVNPGDGKAPIRTGRERRLLGRVPRQRNEPRRCWNSLAKIPAGDGPRGRVRRTGLGEVACAEEIATEPLPPRPAPGDHEPVDLALAGRRRAAASSGATCSSAACRSTSTGSASRSAACVTRSSAASASRRVPETMSRLRSRKQEIGEQIEGRRTAARFEITGDPERAADGAAPRSKRDPQPTARQSRPRHPRNETRRPRRPSPTPSASSKPKSKSGATATSTDEEKQICGRADHADYDGIKHEETQSV